MNDPLDDSLDESPLLQAAIAAATAEGATEVISRLNRQTQYQVRFSNSQVDVSKQWNVDLLEVFVSNNGKITVTEIQAPTPEKVREDVTRTARFVKSLPFNPIFAGIEERADHAYPKVPGLYDSRIESFYERAPELVNAAIQAGLDAGARKVAGVLYFGKEDTRVRTSTGAGGAFQRSGYRLTVRAFVDAESSGQDIVVGRDLGDVEAKFTAAGAAAGRIAKQAEGGAQGTAGTYDVILSPSVAADLMDQITWGANFLLMMIGMSCLTDKMKDTQVAAEALTVADNALVGEGLNSRPFDVEGTPSRSTTIIEKGVFKNLIHNTSSSEFKRARSTGNSEFFCLDESIGAKFLAPVPTNFVYEPGDWTLDEMIAESTRPTIYITSAWYTRFTNQAEGTFSTIPRDGMFLIEHGEIQRPLRKLRLADNLLGMAKRITAMGKEAKQVQWWEVQFPTFIPVIKIENCRLTSATQ